jgi:hypothetical protein
MRTTTCAFEAAGISVRASNTASAIFFMVNQFLQVFQGVRRVKSVLPVEVLNRLPAK